MSEPAAALHDLVLSSGPRSLRRSAVYLAVAAAAVFAIKPAGFGADAPVINDFHTVSSMNAAVSYAYCGRPYYISTKYSVPVAIANDDSLRELPLPDLIGKLSPSLADYCASLHGLAINDNSLMLLQAGIITLDPGVSVAQIGRVMHGLRVAAILAFAWLLLTLGASVLMTTATIAMMLGCLDIIRAFFYSNYPFFLLIVVASATVYGFALQRRWVRTHGRAVLFAAAAGLLAAFSANLRTSYLPVVVAHFAFFVAAEMRFSKADQRWWSRPILMTGVFLTTMVAFHVVLIARFFPEESRQAQYHTVAHPLVLALSTPPNELSRELGIQWLDDVGAEKALSVDPEAYFLGPRYESALFAYYRSLWASRPWQMLQVYRLKFAAVGPDMLADLRHRTWLIDFGADRLLAPIAWLPNGLWILALYAAITAAAILRCIRKGSPAAFVVALLGAAAVLLQIEAGMTYSLWVPHYHTYLAFFAVLASLAGAQVVVNAAVRSAMATKESPRFGFLWIEGRRFLGVGEGPSGSPALPRAWSVGVQALLTTVVLVLVVPSAWLTIERSPTADRSAARRVDAASRVAFCGSPSAGASAPRPVEDAILDPGQQLRPLRAIVGDAAGSIESFCAGAHDDAIRVDPLVALDAAVLKLRPQLSAAGVGKFLHYVRIAMALAIAALMLALGFSPLVVCGVALAEMWVFVSLRHHLFSGAPFAPLLALATVLAYAWLMTRRPLAAITPTAAALAGAWSAFAAAIAPALAPVQWLCFAIVVVTIFSRMNSRQRVGAAAAFVAAYLASAAVFGVPWAASGDAPLASAPEGPAAAVLVIAFGFAAVGAARWFRRSGRVDAAASLLAAGAAAFSGTRLLLADHVPATDWAIVTLFGVLLILLPGQAFLRAMTRA